MSKQPRIFWTEEEWDHLAELVYPMRIKYLHEPLTTIVNRAIKQLPKDRQRKLAANTVEPLIERIQEIHRRVQNQAKQAKAMQDRLQTYQSRQLNREEILDSLTDEEVLERFGYRMILKQLDILSQYKAMQYAHGLAAREMAKATPVPANTNSKKQKPKVGIMGLKGDQLHIMQRKLEEFHIVDMIPRRKPPTCDIYIIWTDYASHHTYEDVPNPKLYTGGLSNMVNFIRSQFMTK